MRRWVLCASLAVVVLPSSAAAQSVSLTESEAVSRLSTDSPRVQAIVADTAIAHAEALAAARWPNPRVVFDRESAGGITEYLTTFGQLIPISGQRDFEMRAASAAAAATTSRADDQMRRARADLRLAFAQLLSAQAREETLARTRDGLRNVADVLARREAAGDAAGFDRLRAEREVIDIEADMAAAASDRTRSQAALAAFFADEPTPSRLVAQASADAPAPLPSIEALVTRAESSRGDLMSLRKDLEAAQWRLRAADRRWVPEPELIVGMKSSSALVASRGPVVSVQAVIPLFDHGHAEQAMAEARANQANARAAALRHALRAEIAGLHAAVAERRAAADRYRAAIVDSADQIQRIAQVRYEAGENSILEMLDAYRVGASARIRQALLDAAVRQAEIELEFVSGWENLR